jgi:hypothetical protein
MNADKNRLTKSDYGTLVLALEFYANHLENNYGGLKDLIGNVDELGVHFFKKTEEHDRPLSCRFEYQATVFCADCKDPIKETQIFQRHGAGKAVLCFDCWNKN